MRFETHSHSHFSNIRLIDSINKPKDMILTACKLGYGGIALTDHEALCGHIEWLELEKELKSKGEIPQDFKCALGNEIYLTDTREPKQKYWHFILIAKNTAGHRALRELSSQAWLNSYTDRRLERVPTLKTELAAIVKKYPNSLVADTACLGSEFDGLVLQLVDAEKENDAEKILSIKIEIDKFLKFCLDLFGDDFYIEIAPGVSSDQKKFNRRVKVIADFYKIKIVIGTDAHFLTAEYREIHKAFLNSKDGEREVDSFYRDAHLMDDEEAYNQIKDIFSREEFEGFCQNSLEIMDKIGAYDIFHSPIIPTVKVSPPPPERNEDLIDYPTLSDLSASQNDQEREWLDKCLISLKEKKIDDKIHYQRLELEASILSYISEKLGNCLYAYFNTFRHYIDLFWECGSIVGPGRGSAGSFLSNYLLGITQLDPVEWELPYFRFLNKDRAELPDIDLDLAPSKRPLVLKKIREERGELNVVQVATFGTTSAKAAIGTACRGYRSKEYPKGIDVDIATYLSSLVPSERGLTWSLKECFEGNEEKERKPIKEFINQFKEYPGLKEIALGVENLVVRRGQHASGVILYNETPFETGALMRSPNGDITTQYDLHKCESAGDTKFDFLVTDICDKLSVALNLLSQNGYFSECHSLREIYNKYLHPQKIDVKNPRLWEALANGEVQDVFQFNTAIGIQTAQAIQPRTPAEMTSANALMRLVAPKGEERPFDRYIRFKKDINLWYREMDEYGLTKEEQKILEPYYKRDYGVPCSQEQLMLMVMDPKISHFTLAESNQCRKVLAKKKIKEIPVIQEKFISQCPSKKLGEYCWKTMMKPQMSYSFSEVHALLYSFIGIQTLVIATQFPIIYWNTACLIVNSQSIEEEQEEELPDETCIEENSIEDSSDNSDDDDDDDNEEEIKTVKEKKKVKTVNYGKVASAIGKMVSAGIKVSPPDINKSTFTFSPDEEHNIIRYGLRGITKVGEDIVKSIIANRPYTSIPDFLSKVKINKPQMINLIKCGAFDAFGDRVNLMREYVGLISDTKKRITLQNMAMLINFGMLPEELDFERRIYNFTKYLKKMKLDSSFYGLDNIALNFFDKNFSLDYLSASDETESGFKISITAWDKIYKKYMDNVRKWIKENHDELLDTVNERLMRDVWNKYCLGSISKWEMDSVSCYFHEHELQNIDEHAQGFSNFFKLKEQPDVETYFKPRGKDSDSAPIPIYRIHRICGTVLDRDKAKKIVSLLTKDGVVQVKIFGEAFANYDKQISERGLDGKKHVIEKSVFSRGNKIIVCGIRRDDGFLAKKYSRTPYHLVEEITDIDEYGRITTHVRGE
jgi:DNA polymerase-3 subunit alpha